MSSSPEQTPNLLEIWKVNSTRLSCAFSGSGITFVMEAVIKHLDFYNLKLAGTHCNSLVKLEHARVIADQPDQLEILLPSGDIIRLRKTG